MEKKWWTVGFLGIIALAILLEIFAAFDTDPNTVPLTLYVINYVPVWIGLPIIIGFAIWLVVHFINYYRNKYLMSYDINERKIKKRSR